MGNFKIVFKGMVLSLQKRRLAVRLWAVNLIFTFFAVGPLFFLMMKHMAHSFSGERALQKLDIFWLGDFVYRYMNIAPALTGLIVLAAILYLLLSVFLNGGVIGSLKQKRPWPIFPTIAASISGAFSGCSSSPSRYTCWSWESSIRW
jgi:hypothetical protein